jgi:hypothetical protein
VSTTLLTDGDLWLSGDVATTLVSWRLDDVVMSLQFEVEAVDNSSWYENVEFSKSSSDGPLLVRQVRLRHYQEYLFLIYLLQNIETHKIIEHQDLSFSHPRNIDF